MLFRSISLACSSANRGSRASKSVAFWRAVCRVPLSVLLVSDMDGIIHKYLAGGRALDDAAAMTLLPAAGSDRFVIGRWRRTGAYYSSD